jgi:hypothetical protein
VSLDKHILVALMPRVKYRALISAVPRDMIDGHTSSLLDWFGLYFQSYPDAERVDLDALLTTMRLRANLDAAQLAVTSAILNQLREPVSAEVILQTQNQLEELAFAGKAGAVLAAFNNGDDVDVTFELSRMATESRRRIDTSAGAKWADGDVLDYIEADADNSGLQLTTFPALHSRIKGLRGGHNICVSAPTDKGKSSLLIRMLVDFAKQAKELYPGRPALYCVNESTAEVLTPRVYQTALSLTREDLLTQARSGKLVTAYTDVVGARDSIRLVNIHGMNTSQVARIIEAHEPYCVVTDMTGRIRSGSNSTGANDVAQLEEAWNTMRELAAMQDFLHIGTTQVSGEGMDMLYPPLSAMQNSKVGIQTTLDLCIMMGALNNVEVQNLRGISTPKNKLARTGCSSTNQLEVYFTPERNIWE